MTAANDSKTSLVTTFNLDNFHELFEHNVCGQEKWQMTRAYITVRAHCGQCLCGI